MGPEALGLRIFATFCTILGSSERPPLKQTCDEADVEVGARLRSRRRQMRSTQEVLADALAVSYQQVQKYETGKNCLSPSKLIALANLLEVEPAFFLASTEADAWSVVEAIVPAIESDRDWVRLNQAFRRIQNPSLRRVIVRLINGIADEASIAPTSI